MDHPISAFLPTGDTAVPNWDAATQFKKNTVDFPPNPLIKTQSKVLTWRQKFQFHMKPAEDSDIPFLRGKTRLIWTAVCPVRQFPPATPSQIEN